jgi:hypothetical protein
MEAHGANSTLMLIPAEQERCFCVGNPNVTADAGSPFVNECSHFLPGIGNTSCTVPSGWPHDGERGAGVEARQNRLGECEDTESAGERCMYHTMGFAGMVEPLTEFLMHHLGVSEREEGPVATGVEK